MELSPRIRGSKSTKTKLGIPRDNSKKVRYRPIDQGLAILMWRFFQELQRRNVIRVAIAYFAAAWLIIQVLQSLIAIYDFPSSAMRPVVIMLVVGLPIVLVISWAYEITPEGIKREREVPRNMSITRVTGRKLDGIIMVVLAIALAYFAVDKFVFDPHRDDAELQRATAEAVEKAFSDVAATAPEHNTIGVLPFIDLSPDTDQGYFADGIAEELLNLLSSVPQLRVAARTSSFSFKDKDVAISTIAEALHVAHILEGSVRTDGDQLRITVQLIEASTGYHLWSKNYDRTPEGIFQIQDEVARNVVDNLKVRLFDVYPKSEVTDPEAFQLFMLARDLGRRQSKESLERAIVLLERVVSIDPNYARAWDELSIVLANSAANGILPWDEGFERAFAAAERSIEVNPNLAMGYSHIGTMHTKHGGDLLKAAYYFGRSLEIAPNHPIVRRNAALLLLILGRHEEAAEFSEYAASIDPLSTQVLEGAALAYTFAGQFEKAASTMRKVLQISPQYIGGHYHLGKALLLDGNAVAALESFEQEPDEEYRVKGRSIANFALGNITESDIALAELVERWGEQWPSEIAQAYAYRGEIDEAFEWLQKEFDMNGPSGWGEGRWMRLFDNLHDDVRWQKLLEAAGVSDAQLAAIEFRVPPLL